MKAVFLFAGFNLNRIIQKKKCQKKVHFMDDALKPRGLFIWMLRLGCCLSPNQNFWLRAWLLVSFANACVCSRRHENNLHPWSELLHGKVRFVCGGQYESFNFYYWQESFGEAGKNITICGCVISWRNEYHLKKQTCPWDPERQKRSLKFFQWPLKIQYKLASLPPSIYTKPLLSGE